MAKISAKIISDVIDMYMDFKTLDEIAAITNLSKGSVYNIIKQWKSQLDKGDIDEIRKFKNEIKKSGSTITDCVLGFRMVNMLKKFNINEDFEKPFTDLDLDIATLQEKPNNSDFEGVVSLISVDNFKDNKDCRIRGNEILSFLSEIYEPCKRNNIKPEDILKWTQDVLKNFSHIEKSEFLIERNSGKGDLSNEAKIVEMLLVTQINTFLDGKKREYVDLRSKISELDKRLAIVSNKIVEKSNNLEKLNKEEKLKLQYLDWYKDLQSSLKNRFNIKIDEILDDFTNMINDFKDYDFDAIRIIGVFRQTNSLKSQRDMIHADIHKKVTKKEELESKLTNIKFELVCTQQTLNSYYELCSMGWGIKELKYLTDTIREIASQNNISADEALKKFLSDVEKDYDNKLGFEISINKLREQKKEIELEIPEYKNHLRTQALFGTSIDFIKNEGVTDSDIIWIVRVVQHVINNNLLSDYGDNDMVNANPWYFFIKDLEQIKNLKSEIKKLTCICDKIITEIKKLQIRREDIERRYVKEISNLNAMFAQPNQN
jgi:hypothetical protein